VSGQRVAEQSGLSRRAVIFALKINIFGLGLMALWSGVNTTLLPDRVTDTAPHALQGSGVGLISLIGVGLATIIQPVVGRASDNWPFGDRRRPFLIAGIVLIMPGLALFGGATGFAILLAGYVLLQLAGNIAQTAFQAFIPDFVQEDERGLSSGVKNLLTVIGAAVGLLGVRAFGSLTLQLGYLGAIVALVGFLNLRWTPRSTPQTTRRDLRWWLGELDPGKIRRAFVQVINDHRIFRLGVIAQFLFLLGTYPAQRFLLMYVRERFGDNAEDRASVGLAAALVVAVIVAVGAGALSDAIGRRKILIISALLGAGGMAMLGLAPSLPVAAVAGTLVAAGVGSFQAVNWALINDDLPDGADANALGVANIATAGAGALAGLFGPLVDGMKAIAEGATYQVTFGLAALVVLLSLIPLRGVPDRPGPAVSD
jgi:MFS family permease